MRVITLMNRKLLIAAIAVVIIIVGAFALSNNTSSQIGNSVNIDANALKDMGNIVVNDSKDSKEKGLVSASSSDLNSILVTNNGKLTIKDSLVNKTGDTATSGDDADFYGVNSAILVNTNGTLDISNVEINTNSKGSNGIFVTNSEASASTSPQGGSSEGSQPPEAAGGNSSQGGEGGQPPEATGNGGDNSQGGGGGQPPEMPSGEETSQEALMQPTKAKSTLKTLSSIPTVKAVLLLQPTGAKVKCTSKTLKSIQASAKPAAEDHL